MYVVVVNHTPEPLSYVVAGEVLATGWALECFCSGLKYVDDDEE